MKTYVYVDLDSLLDTRLGTVARLSPEDAVRLQCSPEYYSREENLFEGVDTVAWNTLFKERDTETLSKSMATQMVLELKRIVSDIQADNHLRPLDQGRDKVKITVNTYPYSLTPEERGDIEDVILSHIDELCPVEVVRLRPEDLTVQRIKDVYSVLIMYDYGEWLESQTQNFRKCQLTDVVLIAPTLWFKDKISAAEMEEYGLTHANESFLLLENVAKGLIDLQLMDIRYWCCVPLVKETTPEDGP